MMTGLKIQATVLGTTAWYATKKNCSKLASDLAELLEGLEPGDSKTTVVIFNLLDKSYFQARGEDGNYIPHRQLEGKYHVDGDLVTVPNEQVKFLFEMMVPIFASATNTTRLLVTPVPRYLNRGCCADPEHAPNRADEGFLDSFLDSLEKTKRALRSLAFKRSMKDMKVINPAKVLVEDSLWGSDPVHPTADGYKTLLDYIIKVLDDTSNVAGLSSSGKKRATDDQLVGPSRRPFWITGPGSSSQDWTTCRGPGTNIRGRGRGWRGRRRDY
jgi:hypothetical protein